MLRQSSLSGFIYCSKVVILAPKVLTSNLHRSSEVLLPNLHGTLQRKNVRSCVKIWQTSWSGKLCFKALLITKFCSAVSNSFFLWISNQVQPQWKSAHNIKVENCVQLLSTTVWIIVKRKNININQGVQKPKNLLQSSGRIHQLSAQYYIDGVLDAGVTGRNDWGLPPKRVNEDIAMYSQDCKLTYKRPGIKKRLKT